MSCVVKPHLVAQMAQAFAARLPANTGFFSCRTWPFSLTHPPSTSTDSLNPEANYLSDFPGGGFFNAGFFFLTPKILLP
jgi:hypothetical protein